VVRWATTSALTAAAPIPATGTKTSIRISTRTNTTESTFSDSKTRPGAGFFIFGSVTSDRDQRPPDDVAGTEQVPDGDVKHTDVETDSDDPDISGNDCTGKPS
jgi:hypothetical protein